MSNAPLTPSDDALSEQSSSPPSKVPYSADFENSLMRAVLKPPLDTSAHLPIGSPIPSIPVSSLPVPLDSPLRTYSSAFPGVLLTHPAGYITGGAGPDTEDNAEFVARFIAENNIKSEEELHKKVGAAIQDRIREVKERMKSRESAIQLNEPIEKEIRILVAQREMELKIEQRLRGEKKV